MAHDLGTSDWGDVLPRAIAAAAPDGVSVWYLGCNGFVLKGSEGTTLFIDPYCGTGDPPRTVRMIPVPFDPTDVVAADAVLATHEHADHVHGPTQGPILAETGATYHAPPASLSVVDDEEWSETHDVPGDRFHEVAAGDRFEIGEFEVTVTGANDPDAEDPVGYVVSHDVGTFFHAGDSRPADVFADVGREFDIDLGVLALGTTGHLPAVGDPEVQSRTEWYADEGAVVEAASDLRLDRLLPSHWDMWKGVTADPTALLAHARTFSFPRRVEIVEIGDRIEL